MLEHELKATVADPARLRTRLLAAGATPGFRGMMTDVRFDRDGELGSRDEVLRVRSFRPDEGSAKVVVGWKGPTGVSSDGYKARRELEYELVAANAPAEALFESLGYQRAQVIDRYVEYYRLGNADLRIEWYPRMDVLLEVEGDGPGIEAAVLAAGLPRENYTADSLSAFALRYALRTGRPPLLALSELSGEPPGWEHR